MKIYTKGGDTGETSLFGGARLPKNHIRIEAYGTIDELNSFVGLLKDTVVNVEISMQLQRIQSSLFTLGSHLAAEPGKINLWLPDFKLEEIEQLEKWIDTYDEELEPLKSFILPGGAVAVSNAHVCRTVCRRAERSCIGLLREEGELPDNCLAYLNRLSDYFFTLARKLSKDLNVKEYPWEPRK